MEKFKVGDKVKIQYINDCNKYNNKIGTITWLHDYNFYPKGDYSIIEKRTQGKVLYSDGTIISIRDMYRETSGLYSKLEKVSEE